MYVKYILTVYGWKLIDRYNDQIGSYRMTLSNFEDFSADAIHIFYFSYFLIW